MRVRQKEKERRKETERETNTKVIDKHLVQTNGPEGGLDDIGNGLDGQDVLGPDLTACQTLATEEDAGVVCGLEEGHDEGEEGREEGSEGGEGGGGSESESESERERSCWW